MGVEEGMAELFPTQQRAEGLGTWVFSSCLCQHPCAQSLGWYFVFLEVKQKSEMGFILRWGNVGHCYFLSRKFSSCLLAQDRLVVKLENGGKGI